MVEAFKILTSDKQVKAILVNIFGEHPRGPVGGPAAGRCRGSRCSGGAGGAWPFVPGPFQHALAAPRSLPSFSPLPPPPTPTPTLSHLPTLAPPLPTAPAPPPPHSPAHHPQPPLPRARTLRTAGGIMKCDVVASGIVGAAKQVGVLAPVVVRLEGSLRACVRAPVWGYRRMGH